jgi:hypothetical protein
MFIVKDPRPPEITIRLALFPLISLFAQSFFRLKETAEGLISLFSHKVHSFFAKDGSAAQDRWETLIPEQWPKRNRPQRDHSWVKLQKAPAMVTK